MTNLFKAFTPLAVITNDPDFEKHIVKLHNPDLVQSGELVTIKIDGIEKSGRIWITARKSAKVDDKTGQVKFLPEIAVGEPWVAIHIPKVKPLPQYETDSQPAI